MQFHSVRHDYYMNYNAFKSNKSVFNKKGNKTEDILLKIMYRYQETYNYYCINLFDNNGSSAQTSFFQRFEDLMYMPKKY